MNNNLKYVKKQVGIVLAVLLFGLILFALGCWLWWKKSMGYSISRQVAGDCQQIYRTIVFIERRLRVAQPPILF